MQIEILFLTLTTPIQYLHRSTAERVMLIHVSQFSYSHNQSLITLPPFLSPPWMRYFRDILVGDCAFKAFRPHLVQDLKNMQC